MTSIDYKSKVTVTEVGDTFDRAQIDSHLDSRLEVGGLDRIDFSHNHHLDLCADRTPEGHEALIVSLSSATDPCERTFAAMSLGYLDDPKVIPALEMAVLTPGENIFVIEAALRSLARYGDTAHFSANSVARLLQHESAIVRVAAASALSSINIDSELTLSACGPKLTDPSLGVRREVAKQLKDLSSSQLTEILPRAIHLLEIGEGDKTLVCDLLKIVSKVTTELPVAAIAVRDRLRDAEPEIRLAAIETIGKLGSDASIAGRDLISIVSNPLEVVMLRREAAISTRVIKYFDPDLLMELGRVIEEEVLENNPGKIQEKIALKREVIELIGEYGPSGQKAAHYLRHALKSGEPILVIAAASALARMEAFEIMIDALNSTDIIVMQSVADAIRGIVYKLKPAKRAKLIALLKLKLGWVKNVNLVDSILALLHALETAEYSEGREDRDDLSENLESPGNLGHSLRA